MCLLSPISIEVLTDLSLVRFINHYVEKTRHLEALRKHKKTFECTEEAKHEFYGMIKELKDVVDMIENDGVEVEDKDRLEVGDYAYIKKDYVNLDVDKGSDPTSISNSNRGPFKVKKTFSNGINIELELDHATRYSIVFFLGCIVPTSNQRSHSHTQ
eukprot:gene1454-1687_t